MPDALRKARTLCKKLLQKLNFQEIIQVIRTTYFLINKGERFPKHPGS